MPSEIPEPVNNIDEIYDISFLFENELIIEIDQKFDEDKKLESIDEFRNLINSYCTKSEKLEKKCTYLEYRLEELNEFLKQSNKRRDEAIKEKENMVIKYANGEKKILSEIQLKEKSEKKCKELTKENEILQHKIQSLNSEKMRICQLLDSKVHEHRTLQYELNRTKNELTNSEKDFKSCQKTLKNENEMHKESQKTIENLNRKIAEHAEQIEQIKREAQDTIKSFKYSEENQAYILDQKCKEQQASLILLRHEKEDKEVQNKNLQITLERLHCKQREMLEENNELSQKVQQLEREKLESKQKLSELRNCADQNLQNSADLHVKTSQLEQYKLQLVNEQEQLKACKDQMNILKSRNLELENDMEICRVREAELLLFTQQLTDKNVRLQSEFTAMETKVEQLTSEQNLYKRTSKEYKTKITMTIRQLDEQKQKYYEEIESLKGRLNEVSKQNTKLSNELFDQKGDNSIIKRKYEFLLKEIQKELQQCRKQLEEYQSSKSDSSSSSVSGKSNDYGVKVIQPVEQIDRQTLIEHIVELQRISAKKSEKIDFLEEHINTLIAELQKKSKILQIYMLREQAGTLTSNKMDNTKSDLAKLNGIMASLYNSKISDQHLTLELSLEINRKLQAVLEDSLLKNITLKKNVDTLGAEIERLNNLLKCKMS